jgi:hypothetical protein
MRFPETVEYCAVVDGQAFVIATIVDVGCGATEIRLRQARLISINRP